MKVLIDTHLRLNRSEIPEPIYEKIIDFLTFPNPEKELARKEMFWNWQDLDDEVYFYAEEDGQLILPRGVAYWFSALKDVEWDDQRVEVKFLGPEQLKPIELRYYQEEACKDILIHEQGIYEAPTGSGKTVTVLEAIRRAEQTTLIIVRSTHIAKQWRDRCAEWLGYTPGLIGEGEFKADQITIALQQTLWSRKDSFDKEDFWDVWGMVVVDECHSVSSETFQRVVERFPAKYRIGVSATPEKNQENPIAQTVLGDIFHVTSEDEVEDVTIIPDIATIETEFTFPYRSTFKVGTWEDCPVRNCKRKGYHVHRNNYQALQNKLKDDPDRNTLIVHTILDNESNCNLVISRSLDQLKNIKDILESSHYGCDNVFMYTGAQTGEQRNEISKRADKGDIIILSTVAEEALDIPRLDRLYLVWPTRKVDLIKQEVGRIRRTHPDKEDAVVYDFVDKKVGVLNNQYNQRRREFYDPMIKRKMNGSK